MLIRAFPRCGGAHHHSEAYARGASPEGVQLLHTWPDANLRELHDLVKQLEPAARDRGSRCSFAIVYPDQRGVLSVKEVGVVRTGVHGADDEKTLSELHFQAGDFLDVAISNAHTNSPHK